MADRVIVFDTTLRDGEQTPGVALDIRDKLDIARQLEKLRVDIIEAGFPVTSPGDFEAVSLISEEVRGVSVCALTHANAAAIDRTWEALKNGVNPLLHIVLSSSNIHIQEMLRKSREEVLEWAVAVVKHARRHTSNIEFSPMDASRTDPKFLYRLLEAVIDAGAAVVNIPDTVGYAYPQEFGDLISGIIENVPNLTWARLSVHCHNDLGMAVANTLEALRCGARQFEGTINGIGERAGNASIEEVVMALRVRGDYFLGATRDDPGFGFVLDTGVDAREFYPTSRLVSNLTGIVVPPNKAIVGANAFSHSSGLHADGVIKDRATFEIMKPGDVGQTSSPIVLGKTTGTNAVRAELKKLGLELSEEEFQQVFQGFKEVAERKRMVTDEDLRAIVADMRRTASEVLRLERLEYSGSEPSDFRPRARVKLSWRNSRGWSKPREATEFGDGPVDAVCRAIDKATRPLLRRVAKDGIHLADYRIVALSPGIDAMGDVTIRIESNGDIHTGRGASTDVVIASAKAYLNALNRLIASQNGAHSEVSRGSDKIPAGR